MPVTADDTAPTKPFHAGPPKGHQNEYYYPVKGESKTYHRGQVYWSQTFRVVPESLQINHDIPDARFVLEPRPGEIVYDQDLEITLVDPGKAIDTYDVFTAPGRMKDASSADQSAGGGIERAPEPNASESVMPARPPFQAPEPTRIPGRPPSGWAVSPFGGALLSIAVVALAILGVLLWKKKPAQ